MGCARGRAEDAAAGSGTLDGASEEDGPAFEIGEDEDEDEDEAVEDEEDIVRRELELTRTRVPMEQALV